MKVTVTYTGAYEEAPGAVEVVSSPYDTGWEQCRVRWCSDGRDGLWRLLIEKMTPSGAWEPGASLLEHGVLFASVEEYSEWLAERVARVDVDGQPFWLNPMFDEDLSDKDASDADLG